MERNKTSLPLILRTFPESMPSRGAFSAGAATSSKDLPMGGHSPKLGASLSLFVGVLHVEALAVVLRPDESILWVGMRVARGFC